MNVEKKYIPKKGDIVWIDFDPAAGKEIQKRRPGLVVSRYEFNRKTMFAVICPITSTIKNIPTRYTLPDDIETQGQVERAKTGCRRTAYGADSGSPPPAWW